MAKLSDYHTHILNKELERRLITYDKFYALLLDMAHCNLTPDTAFSKANNFRIRARQVLEID